MSEQTVIPPVQAGTVTSSIDVEYQHGKNGDGGFTAHGEHTWTFDTKSYHELTGLDVGEGYPSVPQANGHTLRVVTDYNWMQASTDPVAYILGIEAKGVRGTQRWTHYWTMAGYYDVERADPNSGSETLVVTNVGEDLQPYRQRESDREIPHDSPPYILGEHVTNGEELVYALHNGVLGGSPHATLQRLIKMDSPEDAVPLTDLPRADEDTVEPTPQG